MEPFHLPTFLSNQILVSGLLVAHATLFLPHCAGALGQGVCARSGSLTLSAGALLAYAPRWHARPCPLYATFDFECIVTRSHADYFLAWIADAAVEFSGVDA
jgi:hypothetical protein